MAFLQSNLLTPFDHACITCSLLRISGIVLSDFHLSVCLTFSSPQNFQKTHLWNEAKRERQRGRGGEAVRESDGESKDVLNMRGFCCLCFALSHN